MKTLKLLFVLLVLSLQANATGYAHNMFVAHQKLKTGKEVSKVKPVSKKAPATKTETFRAASVKENKSAVQNLARSVCDMATLNDRILHEGPNFLFQDEPNKDTDESIVSKLVGAVKGMVFVFAASLVGRG